MKQYFKHESYLGVLLFFVLLHVCYFPSFSQTTYIKVPYHKTYLPWKERSISWSDFRSQTPENDTLLYNMSYQSRTTLTKEKIDGITYVYKEYESFLNTNNTWIHPNRMNLDMLRYCQTNFNLWELYTRKANIEYLGTPNSDSADQIFGYYKSLFNQRSNNQWQLTNKAEDANAIYSFSKLISQELQETKFDPSYTKKLSFYHGYTLSGGINIHIPQSDYFTNAYGFDFEIGILRKRHEFGIELSMGAWSECQKAISLKKGTIKPGDNLIEGYMGLLYGNNIIRGGKIELTPFCDLGVRFYNGGQTDVVYRRDKGVNSLEKAGPSINIGTMIDFMMVRHVYIKTEDENIVNHCHMLRLKPYFGLTYFSGDMGLQPSFNISLEYGVKARNLQ